MGPSIRVYSCANPAWVAEGAGSVDRNDLLILSLGESVMSPAALACTHAEALPRRLPYCHHHRAGVALIANGCLQTARRLLTSSATSLYSGRNRLSRSTTKDTQQTTNNGQETTNNHERASNKQETINTKQQATNNKQQTTSNKRMCAHACARAHARVHVRVLLRFVAFLSVFIVVDRQT